MVLVQFTRIKMPFEVGVEGLEMLDFMFGLDAIALQVWSPSITVAPHLEQHHGVFPQKIPKSNIVLISGRTRQILIYHLEAVSASLPHHKQNASYRDPRYL
jgi:hypothetical protein